MSQIIIGAIFILGGLGIIFSGFYDINESLKLNKHLTEALYSQFGYKYDDSNSSARFLIDDSSWLKTVKQQVLPENVFYISNKSLVERVNDLENKIIPVKK